MDGTSAQALIVRLRGTLPPRSPVQRAFAGRESDLRAGATVSRTARLAVVDCLYVGLAQRLEDRAVQALHRTRQAVSGRDVRASDPAAGGRSRHV
ncbi:hypothetical protein ACGFZP_28295 [Kitasatospora sp. NPDC048239]|uniref:hypothetical protein n=1 Tax=Kitasatospora sp. NPDC048239 TaxID=3364046 RepID=UPI0037195238